jgi:2-succinyl-5-enolpyruvyl-6-hydroxy-3-cyclohexene-1-carboxylate synthase
VEAENLNIFFAGLVIEELVRQQAGPFVMSPGSRNTPLVVALARNRRAEKILHADERGAAYYALGAAKATGKPAVLLATSGTAVANYLPAVIEACYSHTPLLVLTADRPLELQEAGANQTIRQENIFAPYLRWQFSFEAPSERSLPQAWLSAVAYAVQRSLRHLPGPVHLNFPFREPLAPVHETVSGLPGNRKFEVWRSSSGPYVSYSVSGAQKPELPSSVQEAVQGASRAMVVVGRLPAWMERASLVKLLHRWNVPVLADPASGLRFLPERLQNLCTRYDLYLRSPVFRKKAGPDLVVYLGDPVTSKFLQQFIEGNRALLIHIAGHPLRMDPGHRVDIRLEMPVEAFCRALLEDGDLPGSELVPLFRKAEERTAQLIGRHGTASRSELALVTAVLENVPEGHALFLGNSMPIRDADACGVSGGRDVLVACNRGVSGIDGNVATAAGFASASGRPTTAIIGDLALFHDLNSLQLVRRSSVPVIVTVINNNGGGIFHFLPIANYSEVFEPYFTTPQHLHFQAAAELFHMNYAQSETVAGFRQRYRDALESGKSWLLEFVSSREENEREHRVLFDAVAATIEKELTEK